jgi:hypothetical protein
MRRGKLEMTSDIPSGGDSARMDPVGHADIAAKALSYSFDPGVGCLVTADMPSAKSKVSGAIQRHVSQLMHVWSTKKFPSTFCGLRFFASCPTAMHSRSCDERLLEATAACICPLGDCRHPPRRKHSAICIQVTAMQAAVRRQRPHGDTCISARGFD